MPADLANESRTPMSESEPIRTSLLRDTELPAVEGSPVAPETRKGRRVALGVVLVLSFLGAAWVSSPLWVGIVLGAVMAFTAQPWYRRLVARFGAEKKTLAASFVTLVSGLTFLLFGALALYIVASELIDVVGILQKKAGSGSLEDLLGRRTAHALEKLHVDQAQVTARIHATIEAVQSRAASAAASVLSTTAGAALSLIIAIVTEFYVLLEWPSLAVRLENIMPLDPRHTRALVLEFRDVGRSAFIGTVATAVLQGVLAGIGFALGGVPQPVTWGALTAIASLLPVVGTFAVWVPAGVWQMANGHFAGGLFVLVWGFLAVSLVVDYVVRPRLVGSHGHAHPLLMLVALLGGIEVMGLAGLIVAPIVMSLFLAVLRIYERETGAARKIAKDAKDGH